MHINYAFDLELFVRVIDTPCVMVSADEKTL